MDLLIDPRNVQKYETGTFLHESISWENFPLNEKVLKNFPRLKKLNCSRSRFSYNQVTLEPIKDLIHLEKLYCGWNSIEDLSPLKHLTQLKVLYFQYNRVQDLSPL